MDSRMLLSRHLGGSSDVLPVASLRFGHWLNIRARWIALHGGRAIAENCRCAPRLETSIETSFHPCRSLAKTHLEPDAPIAAVMSGERVTYARARSVSSCGSRLRVPFRALRAAKCTTVGFLSLTFPVMTTTPVSVTV